MSVFAENAINDMDAECQSILKKHEEQFLAFLMHGFASERAKEYAHWLAPFEWSSVNVSA